jgi:hypothetical protein
MDTNEVESILTACETALASDGDTDLRVLGFWRVVRHAKLNAAAADSFGDRIARIDQLAFRRWAVVVVPLRMGTWLMLTASVVALGVIGAAYAAPDPWNGILLLAGTAALLVPTHGLGHLAVGTAVGIRFTHWFIGSITMPQPGVKIDYATYLKTPAARRALMHASGAVVTKLIPFLMLGAAWGMEAPAWAWWVLALVGIVTVVTDILWSGTASDWKRYKRERRLANT